MLQKYNLIQSSVPKKSEILCQFCKDESPLNNAAITESESFKFKSRLLNNASK